MSRWLLGLGAAFTLFMGTCSSMGCIMVLRGNGEVGLKQDTRWAWYHEAEVNDEGEQIATAELQGTIFDTLLGWLTVDESDTPPEDVTPDEGDGS